MFPPQKHSHTLPCPLSPPPYSDRKVCVRVSVTCVPRPQSGVGGWSRSQSSGDPASITHRRRYSHPRTNTLSTPFPFLSSTRFHPPSALAPPSIHPPRSPATSSRLPSPYPGRLASARCQPLSPGKQSIRNVRLRSDRGESTHRLCEECASRGEARRSASTWVVLRKSSCPTQRPR